MGCGCTDKQLINEQLNRQLSITLSSPKISLDQMKNMSIDEIINLYRQGCILEGAVLDTTPQDTTKGTTTPQTPADEIPPISGYELPSKFGFMGVADGWFAQRPQRSTAISEQGERIADADGVGTLVENCSSEQLVAYGDLSAPQIISLASAHPNIIDVGGAYHLTGDFTVALILYTNTGSSGYIEMDIKDNGTASPKDSPIVCDDTRIGLGHILIGSFAGVPSNSKIDVTAYYCSSGENCTASPPTCTTKTSTDTKTGYAIYAADTIAPPAPSMTLTPGDRQITVHWSPPSTSGNIFAYRLTCSIGACTDGSTCGGGTCGFPVFDVGFLPNTATSYTFTGMTNGQSYTIDLRTLTQSNMAGGCVAMVATPSTATGLAKIVLSPVSATLAVNGTTQLSATCTDSNGNAITCPLLNVNSSDTSVATYDSATGLITGKAVGTAIITVKDPVTGISCISPDCCVITVSTNPTHRACVNGTCTVVNGPGDDECPAVAVGAPCANIPSSQGFPWLPIVLIGIAAILYSSKSKIGK